MHAAMHACPFRLHCNGILDLAQDCCHTCIPCSVLQQSIKPTCSVETLFFMAPFGWYFGVGLEWLACTNGLVLPQMFFAPWLLEVLRGVVHASRVVKYYVYLLGTPGQVWNDVSFHQKSCIFPKLAVATKWSTVDHEHAFNNGTLRLPPSRKF